MRRPLKNHPDLLTFFILLAGLGWIWLSAVRDGNPAQRQLTIPRQGFNAPDFELTSLTGEIFHLAELKGRPVILNFWASWCSPCKTEMPAIESAYRQYQSQGLIILAINATDQDHESAVRDFVRIFGLTFPVLLDPQGEAMSLYQVSALPTTFFIRPDGIIQEVVIGGPMAEALLTSRIERLMGEK